MNITDDLIRKAAKAGAAATELYGEPPWESMSDAARERELTRARAILEAANGADRKPLTPDQQNVLGIIRAYTEEHGYAPTLDEIADARGCSKVSVFEMVNTLERKGWIERDRGAARSIRIIGAQLVAAK